MVRAALSCASLLTSASHDACDILLHAFLTHMLQPCGSPRLGGH